MENLISFGNGLLMYLSIGCIYVMVISKKIDKALAEANEKGDSIIDAESDYFRLIYHSHQKSCESNKI